MPQPGAVLDPHRSPRSHRGLPQGIQYLQAAQQTGLPQSRTLRGKEDRTIPVSGQPTASLRRGWTNQRQQPTTQNNPQRLTLTLAPNPESAQGEKDFEYYLTKHAWENPEFALFLEKDPIGALKSIGLDVPDNLKLRVIVQRDDTIYLAMPPAKRSDESAPENITEELMDIWSSGNFFIWFSPLALKYNIFKLRNSTPTMEI